MDQKQASHVLIPTLFVGMVVVWTVFLHYHAPEEIVSTLGTRNGYLVAFIIAFLGGLSLFIVVPYYLAVATLAAGGLHPVILGITAGLGVILGDTTSYLVGYHGQTFLPAFVQRIFKIFSEWVYILPRGALSIILFLYGSSVPFPNDIVTVPLGLARYPYWRMVIPLGAGNIVFNTVIAFLSSNGNSVF